jgi:hypothetical protein
MSSDKDADSILLPYQRAWMRAQKPVNEELSGLEVVARAASGHDWGKLLQGVHDAVDAYFATIPEPARRTVGELLAAEFLRAASFDELMIEVRQRWRSNAQKAALDALQRVCLGIDAARGEWSERPDSHEKGATADGLDMALDVVRRELKLDGESEAG